MVEIVGLVLCTSRVVKIKKITYHFAENSGHFLLKIELLLTVLFIFEREAALKVSAFR